MSEHPGVDSDASQPAQALKLPVVEPPCRDVTCHVDWMGIGGANFDQ
jgi:hypothetical protein